MKLNKKIKNELEKQGYRITGRHSAIKICEWTRKSLRDENVCYKEKFYGIKSHRCCQMSCTLLNCQNKCIHCWRNLNYTDSKKISSKQADSPEEIINNSILAQRKILQGFKGSKKTNMKKFKEAMNLQQFAISLTGEATLYPKLSELIKELRKQNKSTFLVTNGLCPEVLKELEKKNSLPTQLYLSLNTPNKSLYNPWHNSKEKNAWEKFNQTLKIINHLTKAKKSRTVLRLTLVRGKNLKSELIPEYSKLIKKASPMFLEIKSYMAVGDARERIPYKDMPSHKEIKDFSKQLIKFLPKYKILSEKIESRVVLIGKSRKDMKISKI
jgi:tRNA wybutosine-synthesizing protein 1